ncbi:hypothetical protein OG422_05900 [Streptomyces sp. NBC_01525]|uniref:DNA polymerase Y family protein n=1 Tax=Streptomyces sp. NBC_01525 TaxID=2903893 RepID=UPI00386BC7C8
MSADPRSEGRRSEGARPAGPRPAGPRPADPRTEAPHPEGSRPEAPHPEGSRPAVPHPEAAAPDAPPPGLLHVRFATASGDQADAGLYGQLLALLGEFTPVVEAAPPDAALADVRGARRYFGTDAAGIAALVRLRALARYGVRCTIGVAGNPLLARMAAQDAPPGGIRTVPGDGPSIAVFLARRPAVALHGVGPAAARALGAHGLDSVGRIAAAPPATLRRILGARTGRTVYDRARGIDPTPVTPHPATRSLAAEHRFPYDELDPDRRRAALLALADGLGSGLRTTGRAARALTLTVRYADGTSTTRTRRLPEPTAHGPALTAAAYALHAALGLQRARVRAVALRAEDLCGAERATRQLMFDPSGGAPDDRARRIEAAADRARARFGATAVRPAAAPPPVRHGPGPYGEGGPVRHDPGR